MASEKNLVKVLDLLTFAPRSSIESLSVDARSHAKNMRTIVGQPNIIAVGISEKISKGKNTGKLAVTFYVEKKIGLKELTADKLIPPTVPEALSGPQAIPTDVKVIGKLRLEANPLVTRNPLQPGNSIGHVKITAGTFGAVVKRNKTLFLLSNSHVLANSGLGKKGDTIIYPGDADGGKDPADLIAKLEKFVPFKKGGAFTNHVDAAIARPTAAAIAKLNGAIKGLGFPKGTIAAKRGMKIIKVGRTTGKTVGEVHDVHFRTTLDYGTGVGVVGFQEQIFCSRYSKPGDSGALVLDKKSGKAIGLHFAGAFGGSVCNPIAMVLSSLNVQLVTKLTGTPQAAPVKKKLKKSRKRAVQKKA